MSGRPLLVVLPRRSRGRVSLLQVRRGYKSCEIGPDSVAVEYLPL